MEQQFKHIADTVRLSENSRTRIRTQIASRAEEQEALHMIKPRKHLPRLAAAAIAIAAVLTLTAAAAAVVRQFRNDILLSDSSELPAPQGDTPVAVSEPAGLAPHTLEKTAEALRRPLADWDPSERISSAPSIFFRCTTQADGTELAEYRAEDPAALPPLLSGRITLDLTEMNDDYSFVPETDAAYIVRNADGGIVREYFSALYGAADGKGYIRFELRYDAARADTEPGYIIDSTYEEAYSYTTQSGCEFLITADSGAVWAQCRTAHADVSLYAAYLTTAEIAQVIERLSISISD